MNLRSVVVNPVIAVRRRMTGNLAETDARLELPDRRYRPQDETAIAVLFSGVVAEVS